MLIRFLACICLPRRYVFALMGFFATLIGFMIRLSVELTISHMVIDTNTTKEPALYDADSCPDLSRSMNQSIFSFKTTENENKGKLDWDESDQSSVISAYRTGYIMTQFIGGMVADIAGGKPVLGISLFVSSLATIVLPFAAKWLGSTGPWVLRLVTGMAGGTIIPVLLSMMSKWVPHDERAFVASIIFPANLIGQVAAVYITQSLLNLLGWEAVYFIFGAIGLVWFIVWRYTCFSTPNNHPYISESEKKYLNETCVSLIRTTKYELDPLPWKAFLRCVPFWACVVGYTGREWAFMTLTRLVPQFMKDVFRYDISESKLLSYQPYVCMWVSALFFGFVTDILVARKWCTIRFIRKYTTCLAAIASALCIVLVIYSSCSVELATVWMFLGMTALGAYYSGVMINMLDMTPNYAGTMIGVVDNIAINSVILLRSLNNIIVTKALLSQWTIFFWITFSIFLLMLAVYVYFIKTDQIWWDDVRKNGYPNDWNSGLLPADALIDKNGETVFKPKKDADSLRTTEDKL